MDKEAILERPADPAKNAETGTRRRRKLRSCIVNERWSQKLTV
jgi:hypothetical protein